MGSEANDEMGKFSVDKGKRFERELVRLFSLAVPNARISRGFQYRDGAEAPDVDLPGFWLEAKVGAKTNPLKALRQATTAARHGRWPLAVCKDDRQTPVCVMALSDFITFYRQWFAGRIGQQSYCEPHRTLQPDHGLEET
jgi:hypothetical protein